MSMQDPIADMLTRVRNALAAKKKQVSMPASKMKAAIAKVLQDEGYILGFESSEDVKSTLTIDLKYFEGKPVISKIKRISRPGLRSYSPAQEIPQVMGGLGIAIISTSAGVMSNLMAKRQNVGGEVVCFVE